MGTGPRRHLRRLSALTTVLTATVSIAASAVVTSGVASAASTIPGGTPATKAVTRTLSPSAQATARSFWTAARMDSATPLGRAVSNGIKASTPTPPPGIPNPVYFNGVPTVGALFFTTGSQAHFCTASVVNSFTLNLVLTAAHCVYGSAPATNIAYVPEWHQGVSPYGSWAVQSVTVASGWQTSQDPNLDFAFLRVTPPPGTQRPIQLVTGGLWLGINAGYAHPIYVIGYNDTDSQPIGCATASFEFETGQMEFYCNSYWDGTSGGPWIEDFSPVTGSGILIGDIGGYEQGGDYPWASYSAYYSWPILALFAEAQALQA
jgi:V8-like Glu-specific endopeptidase